MTDDEETYTLDDLTDDEAAALVAELPPDALDATAPRSSVIDDIPDDEAAGVLAALEVVKREEDRTSAARSALEFLDGARELVDVGADVAATSKDWHGTLRKLSGLIR
jgi:hypothetical protein